MKIGCKDIGNFKSAEQADAYKKAMHLKNEMEKRATITLGFDEFKRGDQSPDLEDQIPGKGKVLIGFNPTNKAQNSFVDYNPENGQINSFGEKISVASPSANKVLKNEDAEMSIKDVNHWLFNDEKVYSYQETGPVNTVTQADGTFYSGKYCIDKELKIDKKTGNLEYNEVISGSYLWGHSYNAYGESPVWGSVKVPADRETLLESTNK